jgi:hypothetical protein
MNYLVKSVRASIYLPRNARVIVAALQLKTMGIVVVAALAANVEGTPPDVTITPTCRRTNSAARAGR